MRILGAQNFSKSFGGKIGKICTAFTLTTFLTKIYKGTILRVNLDTQHHFYKIFNKQEKSFVQS